MTLSFSNGKISELSKGFFALLVSNIFYFGIAYFLWLIGNEAVNWHAFFYFFDTLLLFIIISMIPSSFIYRFFRKGAPVWNSAIVSSLVGFMAVVNLMLLWIVVANFIF